MVKRTAIFLLIALTAVISCKAEDSPTVRRDEALRQIRACLKRDVRSRQCKKQKQNIETLIELYRAGDKSVLPTLLKFAYLTEFYDEALLSDPDGFLTAIKLLPDKERRDVAIGIAGGPFKPLQKSQFYAVRDLLASIPASSPNKSVAQVCLKEVETNNASVFLSYFPPQTFTSRAADFQTYWYSRDLYALGERPLWPPSSASTVYRFTHLGAFTGPKSVTLTMLADGTGTVRISALDPWRNGMEIEDSRTVNTGQVAQFLDALKKADYWHVPTELPSRGFDGAEWILEGVQNGQYRVVQRWCPGAGSHDAADSAFADAARLLLEFAGHKHSGEC